MVDVNEQIAKAYFEEMGYIVKTDHYFIKKSENGSGPSDIDLIIMYPSSNGKYGKKGIVSVKGWHNKVFNEEYFQDNDSWEDIKMDRQVIKEAKRIFGTNEFSRILVVSKMDVVDREIIIEKMWKKYNIFIVDFVMMIEYLLKNLDTWKNYPNSEFLQTIRMFKKYVFKDEITDKKYVKQNLFMAFRLLDELNIKKQICFGGAISSIERSKIKLGEDILCYRTLDFPNIFYKFIKKELEVKLLSRKDLKGIYNESWEFRDFMGYEDKIKKLTRPFLIN